MTSILHHQDQIYSLHSKTKDEKLIQQHVSVNFKKLMVVFPYSSIIKTLITERHWKQFVYTIFPARSKLTAWAQDWAGVSKTLRLNLALTYETQLNRYLARQRVRLQQGHRKATHTRNALLISNYSWESKAQGLQKPPFSSHSLVSGMKGMW